MPDDDILECATDAVDVRFGVDAEPCVLVIFGASGDLTRRMLIPSLYALAQDGLLPAGTTILGCARTEKDSTAWRTELRGACERHGRVRPEPAAWDAFASLLHYRSLDPATEDGGRALARALEELDGTCATCGNRIYYLATPPSAYTPVLNGLAQAGLLTKQHAGTHPYQRTIMEKPIGHDLESARVLHKAALDVMNEDQLYRIDHYLGKETVQNIMVLRFANAIFEPVWNHQYIEYVEITAAETLGVGARGRFYEEAGVLRDIVQNHLLQVLALVAMEPPTLNKPHFVRDARSQVLEALRPHTPEDVPTFVIRGQYGPGSIDGEPVPGYREEPGVDPHSPVPTFMAMRVDIDNWRWAGVPFYLRAGKRLARRVTEVAVHFRNVPHSIFAGTRSYPRPNVLVCRLQPDEGIGMQFAVKVPGDAPNIRPQMMDFRYQAAFGDSPPGAYERLLLDCMQGDATLFARRDAVELSWRYVEPILESWEARRPDRFPDYAPGSWGPRHADQLMARDGRIWREP